MDDFEIEDEVSRPIDIMFVCSEWGSKKGGLSTFNREFAVNLAKNSVDNIRVHCYVCECTQDEKQDASRQGVNLILARRPPGSSDPLESIKIPPPELPHPDVVVSHGRKFGGAAYFIRKVTNCVGWVHFVHVSCEDLGKYKAEGDTADDAIAENEEKNKRELELCEAADRVVAVGIGLQLKYIKRIPHIIVITPGLFEKFAGIYQERQLGRVPNERQFSVFMFGRGSFEDFRLKGYDIIGKAVALLDRKFELTFVGAPLKEHSKIEKWFLEETEIARNQLTIRGFCDSEDMKKMFLEPDLIAMPSRAEGFGLVALEGISAGIPVLISGECGIAKALEQVDGGRSVVVSSDFPEEWARRIRLLSEQTPDERNDRALKLDLILSKHISDEVMIPWKHFSIQLLTEILNPHIDTANNVKIPAPPSQKKRRPFQRRMKGVAQTGETSEGEEKKEFHPLHLASLNGSITEMEALLSLGCPVDIRDSTGRTPLMISAFYDKIHAVSYLLEKGADPSLVDCDGWNALHFSSKGCNLDIINLILNYMPDIESKDWKGWTPLMIAVSASYGKPQIARYLIENGSDPSQEDPSGWNSLHCASQGGCPDVIELLLHYVPDIEARTANGWTPLMNAAGNGKLEAAKYLLAKGANPTAEDDNGCNALHFASWRGDPHIIELIFSHMPDIDATNSDGWTPLMVAACNGKLEAVRCLIKNGADASLENDERWNSFQCAVKGGNPQIIEIILSYLSETCHMPDVDSRCVDGRTPLMIAISCGKLQAVKYLLEMGADPLLEDNDKCNSLHHASKCDPGIMKLLLSHVSKRQDAPSRVSNERNKEEQNKNKASVTEKVECRSNETEGTHKKKSLTVLTASGKFSTNP
ncbi:death-associated protein kinase 1-like [Stylophora pistillata]|uniref:death-associated protein kinase 1-like n=1 Tax=Stylophora pistillata TaxID=50429 RepID=UPI000C04C156|nr:death-associated protein kinase 1-like [Stylophora pistillata]